MAQSCSRIVHALRQKGVQVDVVHFFDGSLPYQWQAGKLGSYLCCPFGDDGAHTLNRLWQHLLRRKEKYTHLIAFGGHLPVLAASVFPDWLGIPLITLFRGNDLDAALFSDRRQHLLFRTIEKSTAIGTISRDKMLKIRQLFPEAKVFYTPNGIDSKQWQVSPANAERARKWKESHAGGRRVLGIFGHLKAKKGVPFFLDALDRSGLSSRIHLLTVGLVEDGLRNILLRQPKLSHTSLPYMDRHELLEYYPACDAIALPSFYDGMPNVMLEAASLGIPLIASRVDGMKDLLSGPDHELGWLFRGDDADDAVRVLRAWADTPDDEIRQRAEQCRRHVLNNYGQDQEAAHYLEMLIKTLNPA